MNCAGPSRVSTRKLDRRFDSFGTRVTEINSIQSRRHALYELASQCGGERRSVEADPSGEIGVQHLLQCATNGRMTAAKIEDTPIGKEIQVACTRFIPEVSTFTAYP